MQCRSGCAACCIAPSISSPIPGLPGGKRADLPCPQLTQDQRCRLFGLPERPPCCSGLRPSIEMCGDDRDHALAWLRRLERETAPSRSVAP
ncbi:MAG TPA: YkgJ family cysteine cluster protein [Rhodocyclaceae bacterium]|nr:YkgJ family cysteine cluster protein [Rhodocyclaceae bacterium]HRQ45912.1 YkgJ family cysteine cluster protein [Rhodocyclaceae bacterium]